VKRGVLWVGVPLLAVAVLFAVIALRLRKRLTQTPSVAGSTTGLRAVQPVVAPSSIVVAAHPEAVRLGREVLRAGGSALDATIATQLALTLVEPDASGIGGGAFLLYWDADKKKLFAYDGRETAPGAATPALFLASDGEPLSFPAALVGGRAVGVPGVLRMLELAHQRHGTLEWGQLFDGTIDLAAGGFALTPRLVDLLALDPVLPTVPSTMRYFYAGGVRAPVAGAMLKNPELAAVLRTVKAKGADGFYRGEVASDIVAAVRAAKRPPLSRALLNLVSADLGIDRGGAASIDNPGQLAVDDLMGYRAVEREPLCRRYRGKRVCGFPPPTSGGIAVLQILGMLERFESKQLEPRSAQAYHLLAEAEQLAYADRDKHVGDPDFVTVPTAGMLEAGYLEQRSAGIRLDHALGKAEAGAPAGQLQGAVTAPALELASTSHLVVVDAAGNIACMTSSIEFGFGAHLMVHGFLLNNQLTDFSFRPKSDDGLAVANAVQAGKRPRSSMSPIIVFDEASGAPLLALGSPGGSRIIGYVAQTLSAIVDGGLAPQQAVELPRVIGRDGKTEVEDAGWASEDERASRVDALEALGHEVSVTRLMSGLSVVQMVDGELRAGIDPRRDGAAAGD
jgi:gamma-glutamyltranspeptidase/glutathione hydrolase